MLRSMTGFGRGESRSEETGIRFIIELIAVNRKTLDIRAVMPDPVTAYEPRLRTLLGARIRRGSITVKVEIDLQSSSNSTGKRVRMNDGLASSLLKKIGKLQSSLELPGQITISDVIGFPGVVTEESPDFHQDDLEETFADAVRDALDHLEEMRIEEGRRQKEELAERIAMLRNELEEIRPFATEIPQIQKKKMLERLRQSGLELDPNDERVLRELVIFSDKSDVSEEFSRLEGHFAQFENFLEADETSGRSLEFLVQEMFREMNTLGNKAASPEISPKIVICKTELEKIREQVQNVE